MRKSEDQFKRSKICLSCRKKNRKTEVRKITKEMEWNLPELKNSETGGISPTCLLSFGQAQGTRSITPLAPPECL